MTTDIRAALVKTLASTIAHESGGTTEGWTLTVEIVLTALSAKLAELGLRIVPAEATEAMIEIGGAVKRDNNDLLTDRGIAWNIYDAMIAASPDPLAQDASAMNNQQTGTR